jgi:NAD(P)-dependent dehydrogenase (short-subunit alcohol dehydrogenase family)
MSKTILITGSSTGIGKATALHFQQQGWNVIATMRSPEQESELGNLKNMLVTRLDVEDHASIEAAMAEGLDRFGSIDVLLNNAGYGAYGALEATPMEKIRRQFNVNVLGLFDVTRTVLPHFRQRQSGIVINVSSIGGHIAFPLGSLYHGSKFAVEGLSEALSYELEEIGCRMKIVEPGIIATDFGGRSFDFNNDENLAEYQNIIGKLFEGFSNPGMVSEPGVVAEVIYQAATDGTNQLRYAASPDAVEIIGNRKQLDDATLMAGIKGQFGLN